MTKVVRIADEAERIALGYGSSVSKGIIELQHRIEQVDERTKKLEENIESICKTYREPFVTFDDAYWKRMKDIVSCKDTVPKIIPASQLRTIGKIEEDERLEEPIGRQGREVK